ncbi:ABC transporter ATP-binding protein/permease [Heyndrickxia oleronia]|uniref:ABC transporter n=1 Tax=Heyndrickxia oleronia TaxID=38875 RepID=A0A8E2I756_9BACI|nr:ABC transporter ATP-binding protein [Heyndrickxia oleronia]NYV63705.1 ABC transporter ATP-binding protein [Bacillus sp. Gen3]MBU5213315.1 ABC transporter ATP-binding protein/permease [Heyndrickxia oleronia]MCM3452843.1 ABC transporter ATP-binding protein/permease [Heyndrickxia oleronia]MEC1373308.1 ABC transporter ATP-binding protein [Heyndrickxia oleronia]OOP67293.1 ABC transporter [Heyndrickxia oleronia]
MKFLNKYIKKYWLPFSVAVLFLTFEAICDLLQPTIMSKIIDVGVANRDLDYVFKYGGLMLLITAGGAIAASTRNILSSIVSQNFGSELRSDLFRKIQFLSFRSIDKFDRASLVTRLTNDVTQVQVFVNGLMRIFVKAPLLCIGGLIMATKLNVHLAVVLAVVVPLVALTIIVNMKISFPFFIKVQEALDKVNGLMREYLSGVRVVKAFNRFDFEVNKFNDANAKFQDRSISAIRIMSIFSPIIMLVVNLGIVAVLWIGGIRVDHGQLQAGTVIAFTNYMTQILFSLMMISMVFNMFVRAKASASRIGEVFAENNEMTWKENETKAVTKGQIDFEQVTFSYNGTTGDPILKNVTFTCLPGETVGIIGSTGSGKSSLVSLIPRFYDVHSGRIKVDGRDIKEIQPSKLREKIAIVPQKTTLFTGTVIENIRWGKEDASFEEIEKAAKMAQAHEFILETPEGYETRLGQGGVNFSGGQKQRLSIARALVKQPEILILDDSTSALDMVTESKLKESLKKYSTNLTCLLIAQRITSIMDADKILVLDDGEIVGIGNHDELIKHCKVYQEIYRSQIGKEVR